MSGFCISEGVVRALGGCSCTFTHLSLQRDSFCCNVCKEFSLQLQTIQFALFLSLCIYERGEHCIIFKKSLAGLLSVSKFLETLHGRGCAVPFLFASSSGSRILIVMQHQTLATRHQVVNKEGSLLEVWKCVMEIATIAFILLL